MTVSALVEVTRKEPVDFVSNSVFSSIRSYVVVSVDCIALSHGRSCAKSRVGSCFKRGGWEEGSYSGTCNDPFMNGSVVDCSRHPTVAVGSWPTLQLFV